ncbi:MAG: phosphoglucomutase [Crocinitomicaceae bacterium]|nr:phosphoglucomutase [Crocinitomicaceae bacterium]
MENQELVSRAKQWLHPSFDKETRTEVQRLIDENGNDLLESFHKDLDFGTGGLRGIMGVGTNRVNIYTIGMATQGLANYLKKAFKGENIGVAIAHDCRNNSDIFARKAAEILAANGFEAFLFESLRPTPELSYAVRQNNCKAGIVITASHNPKEYNGYKVYWEDGAQLVPPHDQNVIKEVRKIKNPSEVKTDYRSWNIIPLGVETDRNYWERIASVASEQHDSDLKIVFTPLHGTGIKGVPQALDLLGYQHVTVLEEQAQPDGNFPTVKSPNPEEAAALKLAIDRASKINADIVLGTDPDSDRIGIAVKNDQGKFVILNGNQTAAVLVNYMLRKWHNTGELDGNQFICKTIVTTELLKEIADHYKVKTYDTLTGFKWIADVIRRKEGREKFIVGGEESYGYLVDDFVRDKDAIISSVIICEAAAEAKQAGTSFYHELLDIYKNIAFYKESLVSVTKPGITGAEEIAAMMEGFRNNPPSEVAGIKVSAVRDYQSQEEINLTTGRVKGIELPKSNVIQVVLEDGSLFTARPSGTEPKIKFYISVKGEKLSSYDNFEEENAKLESKIEAIKNDLNI